MALSSSSAASQWWASRPATSSSRPACRASSHSAASRCRRSRSAVDEGAVGGLLDQRVLEAVLGLGPAAALADQVEPLQLEQRLRGPRRPRRRPRPPAAAGRTAGRGPPPPSARRARPASSRSIRARITFSTVGGTSTARRGRTASRPSSCVERAGVHQRADELLEEERVALGGLEDPCAPRRRGSVPVADERVEQLRARRRPTAPRAPARGPVRELARDRPPSAATTGGRAPGADVRTSSSADVLGVAEEPLEQLERGRVGPVQVLERDGDRARPRRAARRARGRPRTSGTGAPRARARRGGAPASGSSVRPSSAARYG